MLEQGMAESARAPPFFFGLIRRSQTFSLGIALPDRYTIRPVVEMSVYVVRAFVQLRVVLASNGELAQRVTKLERGHESHDSAIVGILKTLHEMQNVPQTRAIGFVELDEKKK